MKKPIIMVFGLLFIPLWSLVSAEITVPHLELASRGSIEDGNFGISTSAEADIALNGGYKYGITLGLGAEIANLEKALSYGRLDMPYLSGGGSPTGADYNDLSHTVEDRFNNQATLSIRYLEATVRDLFDKPLELSFFIGHYDKLGSGDEFPERFGTVQVGTDMRGFLYYPEGLGGDPSLRFNGAIHGVLGTGMALKGLFLDKIVPSLYVYQDLSFKDTVTGTFLPGHYSADFALMVNGGAVKFEGFAGITYVTHDNPVLRGGLLAYISSEPMGLLIQAGLPSWKAEDNVTIDDFYFLLEPRVRFEKMGMSLTFFYHPVYYMNREILDENNEQDKGKADINLKAFYGDIGRSNFEGGLETTLGMRMHNGEDMTLWVSPFVRVATSGLLWDFKVRVNVLHFSKGGDLAEGFIGIRTAY
jgi:hypothetical protein